jgi:IS30 family transposase
VRRKFWLAIRAVGVSAERGPTVVQRTWRGDAAPSLHDRKRSLSFAEREEIAALRAAKMGVRTIARELGRSPSTISRELRRVKHNRPSDRHLMRYRAWTAQADADRQARRPKTAKLAINDRLREEVQDRLIKHHSAEQIARRLREDFPDDQNMWVSHETIYQFLYVQSRGALKRELAARLRTGRTLRKPRHKSDDGVAGSTRWS